MSNEPTDTDDLPATTPAPVNIVPTPPQGRHSGSNETARDDKEDKRADKADKGAKAKDKASDLADQTKKTAGQAREAVQDPANTGRMKGGAAAVVGAGALAGLAWAVRRRRNRPQTPWEKTTYASRQAWGRAADLASEYGDAARNSDQVAHAVTTGRRAAKKAARMAREQGRHLAAVAPEPPSRKVGGAALLLAAATAVVAFLAGRCSGQSAANDH